MERKYQDGEQFVSIIFTFLIILITFVLQKFLKLDIRIIGVTLLLFLLLYLFLEKKYKLGSLKICNDNPVSRYYSGHRICVNCLNMSIVYFLFSKLNTGNIITENSIIFLPFFIIGILGPLFLDKLMD